jgi:peptidoglycan/LPS O-acetylase OafA/YrhL
MPAAQRSTDKKPNFDLLRLFFAALVIFSHSFELLRQADPLQARIVCTSPGALAVDGFFLISGYLITQSWITDPSVRRFLVRRVLRLYPAFVIASIVSVFVVGPLGADPHRYFAELDIGRFLRGLIVLRDPHTPRVFAGTSIESVNGAMWTISFEFRCYIVVLVLGLLGLLHRRLIVLAVTAIAGIAVCVTAPASGLADTQHLIFGIKVLRISDFMAWFLALFLTGSCYALFRDRIRFTPARWLLALGLFLATIMHADTLRPGVMLAGSYVVFGVASARPLWGVRRLHRMDLSYGLYLYGWPIQKLLNWYFPSLSPWSVCGLTLATTGSLALVSWRLIEQPALRIKPSVPSKAANSVRLNQRSAVR